MLSPTDALGHRPRRVLVAGSSGSGKTTLARAIAATLRLPSVELDALFHGQGWTARPTFVDDVEQLVARPTWVTEWQYDSVRPLLARAADLLVWLDLPRPQVMWQLTRRTLRRRLRREVLWNGNVEPPLSTFATDRDHILRWAWRTYPTIAVRVHTLAAERPDLPIVHLRSHADAARWTAGPVRLT